MSRCGDGSALVVTAALTPTRVAVRSDLLEISASERSNRENADNRQHDADPPVPHICRKHERHRSRLVPVATIVVRDVDVEAFQETPA